MSRNVVSVEFRAVGDGLDKIEKALAGVREGSRRVNDSGPAVDALSRLALSATRSVSNLANATNLLPPGVSSSVAALTQLGGSMARVASAAPVVGIALAGAAVSIGLVAKAAEVTATALVSLVQATVPKAEELRRAFLGLESVARFKGIDPAAARSSVENLDLVKNGLLTVGQASTALKNLLASGFSLEQSVEIVKRFGDAAAFGRQSALEFGQAVVSGTEGIKNRNSILVDNVGVTKNLSVILKEAGFELQDLDDKTKSAAANQALYVGLLRETAAQQGDAEKLAAGYAGAMARIEVGITKVEEKIGALIRDNRALGSVLELVAAGIDLVNRDFDELTTLFGIFLPVVQLASGGLVLLADVLAAVTVSAGLALQGFAALRQLNNIGTPVENAQIFTLGEDLRQLGVKAATTAAKLPGDIARIRESLKSDGNVLDRLNPTALVRGGLDLLKQMTAEVDRRARFEADAAERQQQAFARSLDLERQRRALVEQTTIAAGATGRNPVAVQFDQAAAKLTADADKRLADELDRLAKERAGVLDKIATEQGKKSPDQALVASLRGNLKDLDDAAVTFAEISKATVEAERQALEVDFVNKFADQLQQANRTLFDVTKQLADDNPFVQIFASADDAVTAFRKTNGDALTELLGFQAAVDQLTEKQVDRARAAQSLQIFGLGQRQAAFAGKAGLAPSLTPEDLNRAIFEQFDRLRFNGEEGLKAANKFLTDAASAGQLDVSLLLPDQAQQVFQSFADLQNQIAYQEEEAKRLEQERLDRQNSIEGARIAALKTAAAAQDANSLELRKLSEKIAELITNGVARVSVTAEAGATITDVVVLGTDRYTNT